MRQLVLAMIALSALAAPLPAGSAERPLHMQVVGKTKPLRGHYDFCKRMPSECAKTPRGGKIHSSHRDVIARAAAAVNHRIQQKPDPEHKGLEDHWGYPDDGVGDCEDIVLEKRRALVEMGYPASSLLITKVTRPNGEGHAILTVVMSDGDRILDNLNDDFPLWKDVAYRFDKRISGTDASKWVDVADPGATSFEPQPEATGVSN